MVDFIPVIGHFDRASGHAGTRFLRRSAFAAIAMLGAGVTAGCDSGLLDVTLPGAVELSSLDDPGLAPMLVRSAQNDYECALGASIQAQGMWSSVFNNASTNQSNGAARTRRIGAYDSGNGDCSETQSLGGVNGIYGMMQVARGQAINAFELISDFDAADVPGSKDGLLAKAAAFEGYSIISLSEGYCEIRLGSEEALIAPAAALAVAATRFEVARTLAQSVGDTDLLNLARVGGARALNYIGQRAEAKALAEAVLSSDPSFRYDATYDSFTPRRHNKVYAENNINTYISLHEDYRTNDPANPMLDVGGVPDPRVPAERNFVQGANDGVTVMWSQLLYPSEDSPIAMATWQEAQLIIAEAEIEAGNAGAAVAAINVMRNFYSLPLYAGGTLAEVQVQLIEERRRQLFVQGHRIGDMIRFGIPFEQGLDPKGQPFIPGVTCIPIRPSDADPTG